MKKTKMRILSVMLTVAMLAAVLCVGALAAEPSAISVELDGKALTFTDAAPEMLNGHVYLPIRAVFEALGAEVSYDASTKTITAARNGNSVSMSVGDSNAEVTTSGVTLPVALDAAPYIADGHSYVPVRAAAEALGCSVGWDQANRTVVLVDTQKLIDSALSTASFTTLDKYNTYANTFNKGTWSIDAKMNMELAALASKLLTVDGTITGVVANASTGDVTVKMKMDMSGLISMLATTSGESADELMTASGLSKSGTIDLSIEERMDLTAGKIYMLISGLPESAGLPANTWISMDLNKLLAGSGMDLKTLTSLSGKSIDAEKLATALLSDLSLSDKDTAVADATAAVKAAVASLSDDAFVKSGSTLTNTFKSDLFNGTLVLTTDTAGAVTGYSLDGSGSVDLAEFGVDLTTLGAPSNTLKYTVKASMDSKNALSETITADATVATFTMTITGQYTAGTTAPETAPPAGATVVDYSDLINTAA